MFSTSEVQAIDNWRYANHIATRAKAIRLLIEKGLEASAAENGNGADSLATESPVTENHAAAETAGMPSTQY